MKKNNLATIFSKWTLLAAVGFLALFQVSCAMSAKKCQSTDWYNVGRTHGSKGMDANEILKSQATCEKKGVSIPLTKYKEGWSEGIRSYCSDDSAYKLGFNGRDASNNCPVELKPRFEKFYAWGKDAAQVQKDVEKTESMLKDTKSELKSVTKKKKQLENKEAKLEKRLSGLKIKVGNIEKTMAEKRKTKAPEPKSLKDSSNEKTEPVKTSKAATKKDN